MPIMLLIVPYRWSEGLIFEGSSYKSTCSSHLSSYHCPLAHMLAQRKETVWVSDQLAPRICQPDIMAGLAGRVSLGAAMHTLQYKNNSIADLLQYTHIQQSPPYAPSMARDEGRNKPHSNQCWISCRSVVCPRVHTVRCRLPAIHGAAKQTCGLNPVCKVVAWNCWGDPQSESQTGPVG
jgi:hypothetical protein